MTVCVFAVPDQVANVRVYIYRPTTNPNNFTGLVLWDKVENVDNYSVRVSFADNGTELNVRNTLSFIDDSLLPSFPADRVTLS